MTRAVLFDLDGTLLPMDLDEYTRGYFKLLLADMAGVVPDAGGFMAMMNDGVTAMMQNDGSATNAERFWERCRAHYDEKTVAAVMARMDGFYTGAFRATAALCRFDPRARIAVETAKKKGFVTVLATNPVFPAVATEIRMGFMGLSPRDFALITTYENSRFCKPDVRYYREITDRLGLDPADCAMVGNDTTDDLAAAALGMPVFLRTDDLINAGNVDVSALPHGDFSDMIAWIGAL